MWAERHGINMREVSIIFRIAEKFFEKANSLIDIGLNSWVPGDPECLSRSRQCINLFVNWDCIVIVTELRCKDFTLSGWRNVNSMIPVDKFFEIVPYSHMFSKILRATFRGL